MSEQARFQEWWESTGTNSVIVRAQAWSAWLARAEVDQPQPAEDPDEWVVLDPVKYAGHVLRRNIDFTNTRTGWEPISIWGGDTIGGILKHYSDTLFRCRRRDLPKVEQCAACDAPAEPWTAGCKDCNEYATAICSPQPQPQKTRVRLWMRNEPKGRPSLFACDERPYPDSHKYVEIHHDSEGFYVENQS